MRDRNTLTVLFKTRFLDLSHILGLLILCVLVMPFIGLIYKMRSLQAVEMDEFLWALKNSVNQAALSALGSCLIGIGLSQGLVWIKSKSKSLFGFFNFMVMVPTFLPPLFVILVFFSLVNPLPMGTTGVVLIHSLLYAGLVALVINEILYAKVRGLAETAWVFNVSNLKFTWAVFRMIKIELLAVGFMVFANCFASLSIPLAIGGGKGTTLELLIFEKVRISQNWEQALFLSLIQSLILFTFSFVRKSSSQGEFNQKEELPLWGSLPGFICLICFSLFYIWGLLKNGGPGLIKVMQNESLIKEVFEILPETMFFSVLVSTIFFILLVAMAIASLRLTWIKFFQSFIPPTTALVGLFMILFFPEQQELGLIFGFSILWVAGLYKLGLDSMMISLSGQIQVAQILGASSSKIFLKVVFPQIRKTLIWLSGLGGIWMLGDFAYSKLIFTRSRTLALLIESMSTNYRIELAMGLMLILIFVGILFHWLWNGVLDVISRKFS